jgi:hypothetical protein
MRYGDAVPPGKRDGPAPDHKPLPLYSDEHFRLMDRSFELMGELGNHVLYMPLVERGHLGNRRGLVHFAEKDGKLAPDFRALDRYYAAYSKRCGAPRVAVLMIWEVWMGSKGGKSEKGKVSVTVADASGVLSSREVDMYPANAEFWKTALAGILEHLKGLGIPENAIHWGCASDAHPLADQVKFLETVSPSVMWAGFSHCYGSYPPKAGYVESVDCTPGKGPLKGGWDIEKKFLCSVRDVHRDGCAPAIMRVVPDMSVGRNKMHLTRGLARMGLDYWWLVTPDRRPKDARYGRSILLNPGGPTDLGRVYRSLTAAITVPGPEGALATLRFENLREGIQMTEARITIEKALKQQTATGDLKARCESALTLAIAGIEAATKQAGAATPDPQWPARAEALFEAAGAVQALLSQ